MSHGLQQCHGAVVDGHERETDEVAVNRSVSTVQESQKCDQRRVFTGGQTTALGINAREVHQLERHGGEMVAIMQGAQGVLDSRGERTVGKDTTE